MLSTVLYISIGAVLGAVSRHYIANFFVNITASSFPLGILMVNVIGSFLMGVFIELSAKFIDVPQAVRYMFATGFLSSFTTFSAFSLETVLMLNRGQIVEAVLYVLASVVVSIGALYLGLLVIKGI